MTELARCEYIQRRGNVIAVCNSGTGKTHVAWALRQAPEGLATCQRGVSVGFTHAAGLVRELMEAQDERRLLNLQLQLSRLNLVTTNLPFDEWTEFFGPDRLTGALLDWLTHHVHFVGMNGESYRLKRSRENAVSPASDEPSEELVAPSTPPLPTT